MTRRTTAPDGAPTWIDLLTSDPEATRRFYTELMGWTADQPDQAHGGYFSFYKDGVRVAGAMGRPPGTQAPDGWTVYLATPDARATVDTAVSRGAQVVVPAMDVDDLGTTARLSDPVGATLGIWQPGTHKGFGIAYETGAPVWFELHTTNYQAALDFYREVFGWTTDSMGDTDQFRYSVVKVGDEQLAGVMDDSPFAPDGPSYWLLYLGVPDTDAALAKVQELGGTVTRPAEDTPYGRLASISDPTGASLNLMGPNLAAAGAPSGESQGTTS